MESDSGACASVYLIGHLTCMVLATMLPAGLLSGQAAQAPEAVLQEAEALHRAGKLDQAIEDYRLFLAQHPEVVQVRSDLGAALAGAGRYEEAITEYKRALKLQSLPRIRLNLALAYYKANQPALAAKELEQVRVKMPDDLRAAMLLADCYLRLGENKKVIQLLDPLEPSQGDKLAITYMLGNALVRDGQVARGQVLIDKILRNGDSAEARLLMGITKLMMNDVPGAIVDLQKAVELNPTLPSAHAYYGRALRNAAKPEEAEKALRAELGLNPNDFDSNLYLGVTLKEEQKYDEALGFLQHALEVRPGDLGVLFQIASLHLAERNFDLAQQELEALVKAAPNFLEAHVALATLYYRVKQKVDGDREQAIVAKLTAEQQAREAAAQLPGKGEDSNKAQPPMQPPPN